jgi:hypothetical protein
MDDWLHRGFVLQHLSAAPSPEPWWNMFDLPSGHDPDAGRRSIALGIVPWWTSPTRRSSFLRPLAVATHYLDYALWPTHPWAMHLHNILWYALVVALVAYLYRRALGASTAAGLATLLYAVDEAHVEGTAWIAGRNTVMTSAFVMLTLCVWDRARTSPGRAWTVAAMLSLLCAHACSEAGLAVWPYLIAYAWALDRCAARAWERMRSLWPLAAVSAAWSCIAFSAGYVTRSNGFYVDPRSDPVYFAQVALERLPRLMLGLFGLPIQLERELPAHIGVFTGASSVVLVLVGLIAAALLPRSRALQFLVLGTLGNSILCCTTGFDPRLLFNIGLGAHGILALVIIACVTECRRRTAMRYACATIAAGLLMVHGPLAMYVGWLAPSGLASLEAKLRAVGDEFSTAGVPGTPLIILNTPQFLGSTIAAMYANWKQPRVIYFLGAAPEPVKVSRPSEGTLVLEPQGGYLQDDWSRLIRAPRERFTAGEIIKVWDWHVTIEEVTADGRPARVRFQFPGEIVSRVTWSTWNPLADRFVPVALPCVGCSVWVPGLAVPDGPAKHVLLGALH